MVIEVQIVELIIVIVILKNLKEQFVQYVRV